ncbi:MAG TPA: hypothetical protein VLB44_00070 [Kofleriaceae bacterium]|nr:hypothetical protein [Kofleriaceae bacterium]
MGGLASIGVRHVWLRNSHASPSTLSEGGGAPTLLAGYSVIPGLRIGVHAAIASTTHGSYSEDGNNLIIDQSWNVVALDAAVAVQFVSRPFLVSPWIGRHFSRLHEHDEGCTRVFSGFRCGTKDTIDWTSDFTSFGLTAAVIAPDFPIGVFIDVQTGLGSAVVYPADAHGVDQTRYSYTAVTFGIAAAR